MPKRSIPCHEKVQAKKAKQEDDKDDFSAEELKTYCQGRFEFEPLDTPKSER